MIIEYKERLAKLLATENIRVVYGPYKSAMFDTINRVLYLPNWNVQETYDLLIGHEVGHALFTPPNGAKEALKAHKVLTLELLNVTEDPRIEKLMQRKYPGLAKFFRMGYRYMQNEDVFGLAKRGVKDHKNITRDCLGFLDRVNLKAKLGDLITVEFDDAEQVLFDKVMDTEEWDDVVDLSLEIAEFVKERKQEEQKQKQDEANQQGQDDNQSDQGDQPQQSSDEGEFEPAGGNPYHDDEDGDENEEQDTEKEPTDSDESDESDDDFDTSFDDEDVDVDEDEDEDGEDEESTDTDDGVVTESTDDSAAQLGDGADQIQSPGGEEIDVREELTVVTQQEFDRAVASDMTSGTAVNPVPTAPPLTKAQCDSVFCDRPTNDLEKTYIHYFEDFSRDNKSIISEMHREFDIRKKAASYQKSKTVKTGSLNMSKLHEFKFNDDLFLRSTKVPKGQSHGMIMLIDCSSSMNMIIKKVCQQAVQLAMFCQKANIPFEVLTFDDKTTNRGAVIDSLPKEGFYVDVQGTRVQRWLYSGMSKDAFRKLASIMISTVISHGGTPLNQALLAIQPHVKEFRQKHKLDKMNLVLLTDGAANGTVVRDAGNAVDVYMAERICVDARTVIDLTNETGYDSTFGDSSFTNHILDWYRKSGAVTTITHFFLIDPRSASIQGFDEKEGMRVYHDRGGYDTKIVIHTGSDLLDSKVKDIAKTEDRDTLIASYKKHVVSKKDTRMIVKKFIETIS